MNDATAQLGLQLGQNAVAAGQEYVQRSVESLPHFTPAEKAELSNSLLSPLPF